MSAESAWNGSFPAMLQILVLALLSAPIGCGGPAPGGSAAPVAARSGADESRPAAGIVDRRSDSRRPSNAPPREITFDDIKFEMEKGSAFSRDLLPKRVTALERERVRIRGYILPSFQQTGLTQFVLVRDNMECCFGPGAALYDCIVVRMAPGKTANFSIRPVAVTGAFHVEELRGPDGRHLAIYSLDGEDVQ